ncbi:putative sulfoacetate--CoA ligase [Roseovarius sp. A-2]|nr:putative sulfoacetate--CoA ligase [Roseovarius sp. A-2]
MRLCDGSTLEPAQLIEICRDRLGSFKSPDRVHFIAELPKGPSGKIQRLKPADILPPG